MFHKLTDQAGHSTVMGSLPEYFSAVRTVGEALVPVEHELGHSTVGIFQADTFQHNITAGTDGKWPGSSKVVLGSQLAELIRQVVREDQNTTGGS